MLKSNKYILVLVLLSLFISCKEDPTSPVDNGKSDIETSTLTDIDSNVYKTVKIGNQWWMAENLKVTHYNDGTPIPNVTDKWGDLSTGSYCAYNNNDSNIEIYGLLYNWYAVDDDSIAPAGWHVPTNAEWTELENYLANTYNCDVTSTGNKIGKLLASKTGWKSSTFAGDIGNDMSTNNASGFTALPGGYRIDSGIYHQIISSGYWWSSTPISFMAWGRRLSYFNSYINRYCDNKGFGFSVRLVKD